MAENWFSNIKQFLIFLSSIFSWYLDQANFIENLEFEKSDALFLLLGASILSTRASTPGAPYPETPGFLAISGPQKPRGNFSFRPGVFGVDFSVILEDFSIMNNPKLTCEQTRSTSIQEKISFE
jgi:hypothetical protein